MQNLQGHLNFLFGMTIKQYRLRESALSGAYSALVLARDIGCRAGKDHMSLPCMKAIQWKSDEMHTADALMEHV